jgi:hypothetical protein
MMCIRMHASLPVSVHRRNVGRHPCRHVAEAAVLDWEAADADTGIAVVGNGNLADVAAEKGTAVSHSAGADVVAPAVLLDRVEPRLPKAVAMRSGCAVVRSSVAEPAGSVHTACIP